MSFNPTALSSYHFDLPQELIAQYPCIPRDRSRLMLIERASGQISEIIFRDLSDFLTEGDHLIFNDTKVIPARLKGQRRGGGVSEIFLIKPLSTNIWEVLAHPGRKLPEEATVTFGPDFHCQIRTTLPDGRKIAEFFGESPFETLLEKYGTIPIPSYIQRDTQELDKERYQTVYATNPGAVAAPTAGLHFTKEMLQELKSRGIRETKVTLHVGLGTFRPVKTEDIRQHEMHEERFVISPHAADELNNRTEGKKRICVGTTCCRVLESAIQSNGVIKAGADATKIFIYPGYSFKFVQSLLTNFHLPHSSLLMLVCAFAGHELAMEAYRKAVKEKYRFYSYGDAMLIL